ncbi:hypothetical protein PPL_09178 [Heterostelium album PN500]|uniref:B box-type domain-containing protein n=1 Tax=Heterostelium pallidum (strain ATCC 26659 / Pp 5 / PN500) TaxID=670386 RepID=D3BKU6_HETP5|nr:hypothetical protein PPL_09178 [Heterostelium album PN500]EFA78526.1 hypothetical protein PPL_09178 [Heterostelium album PN500]|eukprot:XP_020430650.1 hypothetical protein PPL_09178 [Heterostelium album PN500]
MDICANHNKKHKLICFDCNVLICSACSPKHSNINSNIPSFHDIQSVMKSTFDSLKSSVKEYEQLQQTEDEISNRFKEIHGFLVIEEHRLKKQIIDNKEQLEKQIESKTNQMKSLNSINHHFANIFDTKVVAPNKSNPSSSSISPDTVDRYKTATIIQSISQCSNYNDFIQNNSNTLFYLNDHTNKTNIGDHQLLNLLIEHNNIFKLNNVKHNQPQQYQLSVNDKQLKEIRNQIQSAFKLTALARPKSIKQSYILSADNDNKLSIINITDRNYIHFEKQNIDSNVKFSLTYGSVVVADNHIYIFGKGSNFDHPVLKYSITNEKLVEFEIKGYNLFSDVSVCYDGRDYIYLIDGNIIMVLIYRININNFHWELLGTEEYPGFHHFSFHFKDSIYSFVPYQKKILRFDINTKKICMLPIDLPEYKERAACTDGKGNIFIRSSLRFDRINVETYEIKKLDNTFGIVNHNLIYHQPNQDCSFIYSLEGKDKNFIYSIENNKWESILKDDQSDRAYCAQTYFQK